MPSQTGSEGEPRAPARAGQRARWPARGRTVRARVKVTQPKITTAKLAKKYPVVVTVDRPGFRLRLFKRLKLAQDVQDRGRAGGPRDAGRALPHPGQDGEPVLARARTAPGPGTSPGRVIPPGPDNPIKARWMGIYAGAGIHGTVDVGSLGTPPHTAASGWRSRTWSELYDEVPFRTPVLSSRAFEADVPERLVPLGLALPPPISSTGTSSQPSRFQKGLAGAVANTERADPGGAVAALNLLSQHRVEGGGGVARALKRMPRKLRRQAVGGLARFDQLGVGGDPAVSTLMKNPATTENPTDHEAGRSCPPAWREALGAFDRSLQAHGMAEKTRRAYGVDLGELAAWAAAAGAEPAPSRYRMLRQYAAHLASARRARAGGSFRDRPLRASLRRFGRSTGTWSNAASVDHNPADLVPSPAAAEGPAEGAPGRRGRRAAGPDPDADAARDPRPRAVRARLFVRPAVRGDRQPRPRRARLRRRGAARARQGLEDPHRPVR